MHRGVLVDCLPWFLLIIGLLAVLRLLLAISGGRWQPARYCSLHQDEAGAVQSLSFVLTLPFFIMILMLIVQASQLMIGQVVVEYAAVAAARSAIVWIPAAVGTPQSLEWENCISSYAQDGNQNGANGGTRYLIQPGSPKYQKIQTAAVLACAAISPSQAVAGQQAAPGNLVTSVQNAYAALAPASTGNPQINPRLANSLAYSANNTSITVSFVHPSITYEPPLATWLVPPNLAEFQFNEVGWQDSLTVTVFHRLALLPGPGRLLFGKAASPNGTPDQVAGMIQKVGNVYTYTLSAATTLGNEGEKSVLSFPYPQF